MKRRRLISALVTFAATALIVAVLLLAHLTFDPTELPDRPRPTAGLLDEPEEFATLYDEPGDDASGAEAEPVAEAQPVPAKDVRPQPTAKPEPAKTKEVPKPTPRDEALEQARQQAQSEMVNAFPSKDEKSGADSPAEKPGSKSGGGSHAGQSGFGHCNVGGGWNMPAYGEVRSELTGSIVLRAIVNREGKVTKVEQIGGDAPASADARLVEACKKEVRRHIFTRNDANAPARAIATITYKWQ